MLAHEYRSNLIYKGVYYGLRCRKLWKGQDRCLLIHGHYLIIGLSGILVLKQLIQ